VERGLRKSRTGTTSYWRGSRSLKRKFLRKEKADTQACPSCREKTKSVKISKRSDKRKTEGDEIKDNGPAENNQETSPNFVETRNAQRAPRRALRWGGLGFAGTDDFRVGTLGGPLYIFTTKSLDPPMGDTGEGKNEIGPKTVRQKYTPIFGGKSEVRRNKGVRQERATKQVGAERRNWERAKCPVASLIFKRCKKKRTHDVS